MRVRHDHVEAILQDTNEKVSRGGEGGTSVRSPEGPAIWRRADLVVHDGAQTHDAHMHIIFLADQPGVLQSPPAGQRVTSTADDKNWG